MGEETSVYVAFEEGGGIFHYSVPAVLLPDGSYKILPNEFFEFDGHTQLFNFGPGDIIRARMKPVGSKKELRLTADKLVSSGSNDNDFKRLLFSVLAEDPDPSYILAVHGQIAVRLLLTECARDGWVYPEIRDWVDLHRRILEEAL
ncbi:MAG: hypothetical protein KGJ84_01930 [Elusimicrobia bacterium]|nr:hypothetical protein [Elusimicrobiota bacterium]